MEEYCEKPNSSSLKLLKMEIMKSLKLVLQGLKVIPKALKQISSDTSSGESTSVSKNKIANEIIKVPVDKSDWNLIKGINFS